MRLDRQLIVPETLESSLYNPKTQAYLKERHQRELSHYCIVPEQKHPSGIMGIKDGGHSVTGYDLTHNKI